MTRPLLPAPGRLRRLVATGVAAGLAYVAIDAFLDDVLVRGEMATALHALHGFVDRVVPVLTGALAGVALHYTERRAALALTEARRADDLQDRLQRIERDQAVWVVAAATLHEVKTPLHTLGLLLDELDATAAGDDANREALLGKARAQVDRAGASLVALRALARQTRAAITSVDLALVARELARDLASAARSAGVSIDVGPGPLRAQGDAAFVRLALENLVANALDGLRERGGPGRIHLELTSEGAFAVVRVRDDGPGVPPAARQGAFEPLASDKPEGLGLGLAIARALARAMHGDVAFVDQPPWATSVELRLPAGDA